jgi:trehalose/maltose hydrolase-like predicted phosphorylase
VIGPNEYQEGVDDNAFTNAMARWNLERGREMIDLLCACWPERGEVLWQKLALKGDDLADWRDAAVPIVTGSIRSNDRGVRGVRRVP